MRDEVETEIRFESDHVVMQLRDHHIMQFLRAQAMDTDLGSIKIRVPALDNLWSAAYSLGVSGGIAIAEAAADKKAKTRKS